MVVSKTFALQTRGPKSKPRTRVKCWAPWRITLLTVGCKAEAAGPVNYLCVNFFPGESRAVRSVVLRKSPVEAGPLFLGSL